MENNQISKRAHANVIKPEAERIRRYRRKNETVIL